MANGSQGKQKSGMKKEKKTAAKKRGMTKKDWAAFFAAT